MAHRILDIDKATRIDSVNHYYVELSLGACLGGNLTIIGAAANVIVSENAAKAGYPIPFMRFMKYGVGVVLISLVISTGYIYLRFLA